VSRRVRLAIADSRRSSGPVSWTGLLDRSPGPVSWPTCWVELASPILAW